MLTSLAEAAAGTRLGIQAAGARWGWLRIVPASGGVRVSPIHIDPGCGYLHGGYEDLAGAEVVRVLVETLEDHPILGSLRVCRKCAEAAARSREARERIAAAVAPANSDWCERGLGAGGGQ